MASSSRCRPHARRSLSILAWRNGVLRMQLSGAASMHRMGTFSPGLIRLIGSRVCVRPLYVCRFPLLLNAQLTRRS
eukprot:681651-Prymnesium_polylepis.1